MDSIDLIGSGNITYAMDEVTKRPIHILCHDGMLRVYVDHNSYPWAKQCKWIPLGYEQLSVGSSAMSLSPPDGAVFAVIAVESKAARYRDDGIDPTTTAGMPISVDKSFVYHGDLVALRFIRDGAGLGFSSAIINVNYYRYPE